MGPDFKAPAAPATPGFTPRDAIAATTASVAGRAGPSQRFIDGLDVPGRWWELYQSPQLDTLIEHALANSPTLASAQATLRQAKETAAAGRGSLLPSLTGNYQTERQKSSGAEFGLPGAGSFLYTLDTATVNVSYTLDVFGGVRRQIESLDAQAEADRFALEASYMSLTANIVAGVVNEASLRAQIAANETIATAQRAQLDITQRRVTVGGASRSDVLQQQTTLQATLAMLPTLRAQLSQARNQLAAYTGTLPADYDGAPIELDSLTLPTDLPVSVPSSFVEQRPDIRQYSALLHQATAQIGVATANLLPQLTLTGSYGGVATRVADLFDASSVVYSLIGAVAQPLFKGGQLVHQRRAAIAAAQLAAANYRATVIVAFQNVSDTLYALQGDAQALAAQTTLADSSAENLQLVQVQFKSGAASYLQVLAAEQSYQTATLSLVKARAQRYADTAALFQALGGGWWNRQDITAHPDAPAARGF